MSKRTELKIFVGLISLAMTIVAYPITWFVPLEWTLVILAAISTITVSIYSYEEDLIEK
ncbi:hypothetical protein [Abyssicoccus albus]|uniref:Uncharacterized protein n=1 Tax=Abyssicoccus albus TaxID=1817405 RepID=A0A3N5C8I4_9BACL|nr:hypothetical protein [Abyssicoccus albus]RPF54775.1 hypothetical protein EDD62_1736 [Abyssicoccus albus]